MVKEFSEKDIEILEQRGLWKASLYLKKTVKKSIKKKEPLRIGFIVNAHKLIFDKIDIQNNMAGKYRKTNCPELKRIDGTPLKITDWRYIANEMAKLDEELREYTGNIGSIRTKADYNKIIYLALRLSHRLACIHPFQNGNGRSSRLLANAILIKARLSPVFYISESKAPKKRYLKAMRQADDGNFEPLKGILLNELIKRKEKDIKIKQRKEAELCKRRR